MREVVLASTQLAAPESVAERRTRVLEQVPDVVVHGKIEHLPATLNEAQRMVDQVLPAVPVGVLEGVIEDEKAGLSFHGDRSEAHAQGKKNLSLRPCLGRAPGNS